MSYRRVPLSEKQELTPGLYEVVFTVKGGDASQIGSKAQLEARLRSHLRTSLIAVRDWAVSSNGRELLIRFEVLEAKSQATGDATVMFVPVIITAAVIALALGFLWAISVEVKEIVRMIPEPVRGAIGVGMATATTGLGVVLIAGGVLWLWGTAKRDGAALEKGTREARKNLGTKLQNLITERRPK